MSDQLLDTPAVRALIDLALEEDLGRGDVTTQAVIAPNATAIAKLVAREELVLAGLGIATAVFKRIDTAIQAKTYVADGATLPPNTTIATYEGNAASILAAERTALNFIQRLSGIATLASAYVKAAGETGLRVADTRKTTPGFRLLEKYAVRMGGASNHRFDLGSGVLIKDNHIAVCGGVAKAIARARGNVPHSLKIEVEVDSLEQFDEAVAASADIVLLDNFPLAQVLEAVARAKRAAKRPLLEVSGGVTLAKIPEIAKTGVDIVSVGALTHSAPSVDLALDIDLG